MIVTIYYFSLYIVFFCVYFFFPAPELSSALQAYSGTWHCHHSTGNSLPHLDSSSVGGWPLQRPVHRRFPMQYPAGVLMNSGLHFHHHLVIITNSAAWEHGPGGLRIIKYYLYRHRAHLGKNFHRSTNGQRHYYILFTSSAFRCRQPFLFSRRWRERKDQGVSTSQGAPLLN